MVAGVGDPVIAWVDARVGVAGDMLAGACVAAGADAEAVRAAVADVSRGEVDIRFDHVTRGGLSATHAHVALLSDTRPAHRNLSDIVGLLDRSCLDSRVRAAATAVFTDIAEVEAVCHGVAVEQVHFHEVGAWDSIADVVAVLVAWATLGWPEATSSEVGVGSGMVSGGHGPLSVPAPAVAGLLARSGLPSWSGPLPFEAATPTGVALLAHLTVHRQAAMPPMVMKRSGFGAGSADPAGIANITRVIVGEPTVGADSQHSDVGGTEDLVELQANIDDLDPRAAPGVVAALLDVGALDAWWTPITMKRGRPALQLGVLCRDGAAADLMAVIYRLTPTLGVRWHSVQRHALDRRWESVVVRGERIAVKLGLWRGQVVTCQPEWREVQHAAEVLDEAPRAVLAQASAQAWTQFGAGDNR